MRYVIADETWFSTASFYTVIFICGNNLVNFRAKLMKIKFALRCMCYVVAISSYLPNALLAALDIDTARDNLSYQLIITFRRTRPSGTL